ncbi:DUF3332 domain-containing protein [Alistipes sp. OttesenSCG-928-L06]|nr:DUF3332 domain-containing protein [Alistipes sp. OttesenSCG-928-L06]
MKRSKFTILTTLLLCGVVTFSSCIGSFKLTNNVLSWNKTIGGKFVNELVFIAFHIVPVYEITILADILVLNSIEFWSGRNPVSASTDVQKIQGENGEYLVERGKTGYTITNVADESVVELRFNEENQTWSAISNGEEMDILTFNADGKVVMHLPDGTTMDVEPNEAGVIAFQQYVDNAAPMFAVR